VIGTVRQALGANSLSAQLSRAMLALVGGFWLLSALAVGVYLNFEINETLDTALQQSAQRILELAAHELQEASSHGEDSAANPAPAPSAVTGHASDSGPSEESFGDYLMYQVVNAQGVVQMRSTDAPPARFAVALATGFASTAHWRVYTLHDPIQDLYIHTADPLAHRAGLRLHSLMLLAVPLLGLLPLLGWLMGRVVRRRLAVVDTVVAEVRTRGGENLSAVAATGLPTELAALAASVNHLLQRLDDALQTERALAANAAHELRTPLTVTQLRLANLLDMDLSPAARAEVASASEALYRLKRRTEKLLQLSRAESGAAQSRGRVSLNQVVRAVLQDFEGNDAAYQRLRVVDERDVDAEGDFDAIAIVLRNLIENSLRYSGASQVEIRIDAPARLTVRDSGAGVDAAQLTRLTQRHVRQSAHGTGYGLGLSIVKTIIAHHGATLRLSSPPQGQAQGFEARIDWREADPS
jgi:two-component system, OmpR family, sensor kinase